jgi:hypothetical protein
MQASTFDLARYSRILDTSISAIPSQPTLKEDLILPVKSKCATNGDDYLQHDAAPENGDYHHNSSPDLTSSNALARIATEGRRRRFSSYIKMKWNKIISYMSLGSKVRLTTWSFF